MAGRKLVMAGMVAGSVTVGMVVGAVVFTPGLGLAASPAGDGPVTAICDRFLGDGPLAAAADAIGVEPATLVSALRDGRTIADVAEAHGIDPADVVDAIVADERARLDRLVQDGVLSQQEADERAADLEQRVTDLVNGDLPMPDVRMPIVGHPGLWGFADGPLAAAADAIGIRPAELLSEVASGATVAEVAEDHGVAVSDVVDAIVGALQDRLDAATRNGWITSDEADERAADLHDQAGAIVNGDLAPFPFPPMPGGPGRGMFGGHFDRSTTDTAESSL